jgi:hypothetical protein
LFLVEKKLRQNQLQVNHHNLKRAIMCQPYNVGKTSAKLYMLEKVDKDEYKNNKD